MDITLLSEKESVFWICLIITVFFIYSFYSEGK